MGTKRKPPESTGDAAIYHRIRAMPAAITEAQLVQMETNFGKDSYGPTRRTALAVLSRPCEHLFAQIESDRTTAVAIAAARASIADYLAHLAAVIETMKAAELRLTVALCVREDMETVIAEAATT